MAKRILVVDDERDVCAIIKNALRLNGHEVMTANDGFAAIGAAVRYRPDLIVLDVMMPKMSGFQVCEALRKRPEFMSTPILFLTAKDTPQDMKWAKRAGATDYMTKPFEIYEFLEKIHQLAAEIREPHGRPKYSPVRHDVFFTD